MKRIITICAAILMTASVFAQSPEKMSYQAVVRDGNSNLVSSTAVSMQISILQDSSSGTAVYVETQTPTSNANGLVSLEIGSGTVVSGTFATIDWANGPYFIKTEIDPTGGTSYTITGTSQLLSVPYALHAKTAETVSVAGGGDFTHYVGELFDGGIVVAVWKENGIEHGIIASLTDVNDSARYSSITATLIGATAQSPIDGQANTTAIVAQGDLSGAAYLCENYSAGGFTDWYLPAAWELNQCYNAAFVVNTILGTTNGFQFADYWSSTEHYDFYAWSQGFDDGGTNSSTKGAYYRVRAVRRF
ncbi:MAG: DUF1566 domain-containing protein [Crocinitomicaceae bacterium]